MRTNIWLRMNWSNHYLKWNPRDFGGIKSITVEKENVWVPDITLWNRLVLLTKMFNLTFISPLSFLSFQNSFLSSFQNFFLTSLLPSKISPFQNSSLLKFLSKFLPKTTFQNFFLPKFFTSKIPFKIPSKNFLPKFLPSFLPKFLTSKILPF